jgi:putative FmdB family regulatory protein
MPTYTYECEGCGAVHERRTSMSDHSPTIACGCGELASQVWNWQGESFVKGRERPFKLDGTCVPIGWEKGNTDCEKQEARYRTMIAAERKAAKSNRKQATKQGIRKIGSVPRELMRMRQNQYGKEYLSPSDQGAGEVKSQLKSEGLLFDSD